MNRNPFNHDYFIGYINQVSAQNVQMHIPSSILLKNFTFKGEYLNGGLVGGFVLIEGLTHGFLARILELALPEKERLNLSEKSFNTDDFHPKGQLEILLSFDLFNPAKIEKGLNGLPSIGAKVFACSGEFIKGYFRQFGVSANVENPPTIELGKLTQNLSTSVEVSQQAIFSRHCAIVGTTGGGKSFTVSKLIEGLVQNKSKVIIIDPSGEYASHDNQSYSADPAILGTGSFIHYSNLTVGDLFVLFRPSGQVQVPILMEAIKSLKIVKIRKETGEKLDIYEKSNQPKSTYQEFYKGNTLKIESPNADFDIIFLSAQIQEECVWESANYNKDLTRWGDTNQNQLNNSASLILRVNNQINNPEFSKLFGFAQQKTYGSELTKQIDEFLVNKDKSLLRIGFEDVGFDFQAREIIANAIGKYLLGKARTQAFEEQPLVLFVDEAHQFLNKAVKDEYFDFTQLKSFDSIAKEGRKYGLFLGLATQMPRDIPAGTLSQIGTFIVHRLINNFDKDAIANACSSANKSSLNFLPVLGSGEAILMGVDFPMPVMLKVDKPKIEPNSGTPLFRC